MWAQDILARPKLAQTQIGPNPNWPHPKLDRPQTLQDQTVRINFHFFSLKQSRVIGKHGFQSIFAFTSKKI